MQRTVTVLYTLEVKGTLAVQLKETLLAMLAEHTMNPGHKVQ